jgi:hypothetical protein
MIVSVSDSELNNLILHYWDKSVSKDNSAMKLSCGEKCSSLLKVDGLYENFDGWYASYDRGTFCWFKNEKGHYLISWNGNQIEVDSIARVEWGVELKGRYFRCVDRNGEKLMSFRYHTIGRLFSNPGLFILEVLAPDDDFGLVSDLPSFFHSCFVSKNIETQFEKLQHREMKGNAGNA